MEKRKHDYILWEEKQEKNNKKTKTNSVRLTSPINNFVL